MPSGESPRARDTRSPSKDAPPAEVFFAGGAVAEAMEVAREVAVEVAREVATEEPSEPRELGEAGSM